MHGPIWGLKDLDIPTQHQNQLLSHSPYRKALIDNTSTLAQRKTKGLFISWWS